MLCFEMPNSDQQPGASRRGHTPWLLLLLLPYVFLLFPAMYARATPTLLGFPFFYWYQFLWVILASIIMGIVYIRIRD